MNFGMRCHDICPKGSMEIVFDAVRDNGISQIQLAFGKSLEGIDVRPGHYSPGLAHKIENELKTRNIHVAVLGCYINPTNPDEDKRREEVAKFIEHLKYAKIIGADMVGTETGRYSADFSVVQETYTEECYQLFLKSMREIVSAAEKLGVIVGVEAVHDHTLYSPEMMKRFLDDIDSPNVEAILDPVNLITTRDIHNQENVLNRVFKLYGDRVTMMHIKDVVIVNGEPEFEHVGDGVFDYAPLLCYIKKQKPYITMLLENSTSERYHKDVEYLEKIYEEV